MWSKGIKINKQSNEQTNQQPVILASPKKMTSPQANQPARLDHKVNIVV